MQRYNFSRAFCLHISLPARGSLLALSNRSNTGWVFSVFIDKCLLFSFLFFSPQILMNILAFLASLLSFHFIKAFGDLFLEVPKKGTFFFLNFWTDNLYLLCAA